MSLKSLLNRISIFIFIFFLFNYSSATILVKAGDKVNYSCEKNIYYIQIEVTFSEKPNNELYFFTLTLSSPDNFNFKCALDYTKSQIFCFKSIAGNPDLIRRNTFFQMPYPFPELKNIEWDYDSFMQKIYNKIWRAEQDCGNQNLMLNNLPEQDNKILDLEGSISSVNNEQCHFGVLSNEKNSKYNFDINISFEKGEMLDLIKDPQNKDNNDIELLQEIWIPLLPSANGQNNIKFDKNNFQVAICKANNKINKTNFDNFSMNCHIPIIDNKILKGIINIKPFFDKLYLKQNNKINIVSIYFKINYKDKEENHLSLSDNDKEIICPNLPVFSITSKDYITMGEYYDDTNKYSFFIVGTLTNGYFKNNETLIALNETSEDIRFYLKLENNLITSNENEINATCVIPKGSRYNMKNFVTIKCIGEKKYSYNKFVNRNVDINLNWNLKENNYFKNIIISWPKTYDKSMEKNIFNYHLTGLSIRQSNFGCHQNNFDFFVYIYNIYSQPKLNFNLPLTLPKNTFANCEIFDSKSLKCSIKLKHKKLYKGDKVMLPPLGSEYDIFNIDGNRIIFTMNNFSSIKNDHDFYVTSKEECGNYMVIGTLKDMGISSEDSVIIYIFAIIGIVCVVVGFTIYFYCKIKNRIKRGMKLTTNEEAKDNQANVTTGIKA